MKNYFARTLRYTAWANRQTLQSLDNCPAAQPDGLPLFAHVLAAENVWISRLQSRQPDLPVWPELTLEVCRKLVSESDQAWKDYFAKSSDEDMLAAVDYQTSRGDPFCNTVCDILTHVMAHGSYHRGQIAKVVVANGGSPAVTDFIIFVRNENPGAE